MCRIIGAACAWGTTSIVGIATIFILRFARSFVFDDLTVAVLYKDGSSIRITLEDIVFAIIMQVLIAFLTLFSISLMMPDGSQHDGPTKEGVEAKTAGEPFKFHGKSKGLGGNEAGEKEAVIRTNRESSGAGR